jgi:hypothetical protein
MQNQRSIVVSWCSNACQACIIVPTDLLRALLLNELFGLKLSAGAGVGCALQGSILTDALNYVMQAIGLQPLNVYLQQLFNVSYLLINYMRQ